MTAPAEERALLSSALGGDDAALRRLVDYLAPVLQRRAGAVLFRMRGHRRIDLRHEVADLTQAVFLHLFADRGRLLRTWEPGRGASLASYVGLICHRHCISLLRGARAVASRDQLAPLEDCFPSEDPPPDDRVASRQEASLVLAGLQSRLSPLGLDLFYRLFVHQEEVSTIMEATGLTANAVYIWRSRLQALTQQLRAELARKPEGGATVPVLAQARKVLP